MLPFKNRISLCWITFFSASFFSGVAEAERFSFEYNDTNYVLCEGIGAGASGTIKAYVTLDKPTQTVSEVYIIGKYTTADSFSAHVTLPIIGGGVRKIYLETPNYDFISVTGEYHRTTNAISVVIDTTRPLNLGASSTHSNSGGICPSSFEETMDLN